jgi:hypothetical protein
MTERPHLVLGYHGCDQRIGEGILRGAQMATSVKGYNWLGTGFYFWESDPVRAMHWAIEARERHQREKRVSDNQVRDPYVVGAVIKLGKCLDLTTFQDVALVRAGYKSFVKDAKAARREIPKNRGADMKARFLDCAVINHTCSEYLEGNGIDFHSVRALFLEGKPLYPKAGFREKTHTQICVRRYEAILGFFRIEQPAVRLL